MAIIDQARTWRSLEERLATTEDPRHRQMLETVITHAKAEAAGDLEGLMATLGPSAEYHFWGDDGDQGPKGRDAISAFYRDYVASKAYIFEMPMDRIVVDDHAVVTEGTIRTVTPGAVAKAQGYDVDDDAAAYLTSARVVILWPFDEQGQLIGEDSYGFPLKDSVEKLGDIDLPDAYRSLTVG